MPRIDQPFSSCRWIVVALAFLLSGCDPTDAPPQRQPADAARSVPVTLIDRAGFAEVLARHRGKVVFVDYWATWCPACVERFPHTVELAERLSDRGLVVVAVSLNDPDEIESVRAFLARRHARFENYLSRHGPGPASADAFHLTGALPEFHLHDRHGHLHRRFDGASDPSDMNQAIEALLARPSGNAAPGLGPPT
ncbi:MAG: TlpA family protein disulfide reductase [Pirellulales bacterium]|nr:TlpA family protein disulfide reductase [Pirellulales bacterium]